MLQVVTLMSLRELISCRVCFWLTASSQVITMHVVSYSVATHAISLSTPIATAIYVIGFTKAVPIGTRNEFQFIADY